MKAAIVHKPSMAQIEVFTNRDAFESRLVQIGEVRSDDNQYGDLYSDIFLSAVYNSLLFHSVYEDDWLLITIEEPLVQEV